MLPLGLRNNNPGNIEFGGYARSVGAPRVGEGGRFAYFPTMAHGLGALARLLIVYYDKPLADKIDSIREIINRWAPGNENNVEAYITHVCAITGLKPDDRLNLRDVNTLWWLTVGIAEHENGHDAVTHEISDADIDAGIAMALRM